jgi:hypothetical protein
VPKAEACTCKQCIQFRKEQDRRDRDREWRWRVARAERTAETNRLRRYA